MTITRFALDAAIFLALALTVSACGKSPTGPTVGPSDTPIVQIRDVAFSFPPTAGVGDEGEPVLEHGEHVIMTIRLSFAGLPDSENILIHSCFSEEIDVLTDGCGNTAGTTVGNWKNRNPIRLSLQKSVDTIGSGTTFKYVHILVFRGNTRRRLWPGSLVSTDALTHEVRELTVTYIPRS